GDMRRLAPDGLNPKYSPDGSQVAYWVGGEGVYAAVPGSGAVWVVAVAGGQPRRVGSNFTSIRRPIWAPGGEHLLCVRYTSAKAYDRGSLDWWLVPSNGGEAKKTGAYDALLGAGFQSWVFEVGPPSPSPGCWSATNTVIFAGTSGETDKLWEIGIAPRTGK